MQVLDLSDGSTLARVRGVRSCWAGLGAPLVGDVLHGVVFIDPSNWSVLGRHRTGGWAGRKTAVAASPTEALISTVVQDQERTAASLRCLTFTGTSVWQWDGPQNAICTDLSWNAASSSWLGVLNDTQDVAPNRLVRWSPVGELTAVTEIDRVAASAYLRAGATLLLSDGSVVDTASGTPTPRLW